MPRSLVAAGAYLISPRSETRDDARDPPTLPPRAPDPAEAEAEADGRDIGATAAERTEDPMSTATATTTVLGHVDRDLTRAAWLAARQQGLGASEVAAALGLSPYETPLELYLRKTGQLDGPAETEAMRMGTLLEPVLEQLYTERTGKPILDRQVVLRDDSYGVPLLATLDAINADARPVELKTTGAWNAKAIGEGDELPEHWLLQAHQQMLLHGCLWVDFGILIGGQKFEVRTVERNQDLIDAVLPKLAAFWRCVETRTPPAQNALLTPRIAAALHGETGATVAASPELVSLVAQYESLGQRAKDLDDQREQARGRILEALAGNTAVLPDGRRVRLQHVRAGKPYTVTPKDRYQLSITKGAR